MIDLDAAALAAYGPAALDAAMASEVESIAADIAVLVGPDGWSITAQDPSPLGTEYTLVARVPGHGFQRFPVRTTTQLRDAPYDIAAWVERWI